MLTRRAVAAVAALAACAAGCASPEQRSTAQPTPTAPRSEAADERLFPPPDDPLFSPTPFAVPSDGPGTWAALRDITTRLQPGLSGDEDAERRRLQACGHLRMLAGAVVEGVSEDFEVEGFPELELVASANNCPDRAKAESSHVALKWLIERYDPYS